MRAPDPAAASMECGDAPEVGGHICAVHSQPPSGPFWQPCLQVNVHERHVPEWKSDLDELFVKVSGFSGFFVGRFLITFLFLK